LIGVARSGALGESTSPTSAKLKIPPITHHPAADHVVHRHGGGHAISRRRENHIVFPA
jgi:hypothetical protein